MIETDLIYESVLNSFTNGKALLLQLTSVHCIHEANIFLVNTYGFTQRYALITCEYEHTVISIK